MLSSAGQGSAAALSDPTVLMGRKVEKEGYGTSALETGRGGHHVDRVASPGHCFRLIFKGWLMRNKKVLLGGLVVAVLCSGCAVKWQVNPVTWTDDKDGYDLRDVRQAVRGSQPGEPVAMAPRAVEEPDEAEVRGSVYQPRSRRSIDWRRY